MSVEKNIIDNTMPDEKLYLYPERWNYNNYYEMTDIIIEKSGKHFDIGEFVRLGIPSHIIYDRRQGCCSIKNKKLVFDEQKWVKRLQNLVDQEYTQKKRYFEKYYFRVNYSTSLYTIDWNENRIVPFKLNTLRGKFSYLLLLNMAGVCEAKFIKIWLDDPTQKLFRKMDFLPPKLLTLENIEDPEYRDNQVSLDVYNRYIGFKIDEWYKTYLENGGVYDEDRVKTGTIYNHFKNLVNSDEASLEWLLKWVGHIYQCRSELSGTAIIFRSDEGCGKQFFTKINNIMMGGSYVVSSENLNTWTDKHSNARVCKFLSILEECSGKDTFNSIGKLKSFITDKKSYYNPKGKDMENFNNYSRWVFNTNNASPMKIGPDDRRYVIFDCWTDYLDWEDEPRNKYFTDLYNIVDGNYHEELVEFFIYIMKLDVKVYNFSLNRPKTKAYEELKENSISLPVRYVDSFLTLAFLDDVDMSAGITTKISVGQLYTRFNDYRKLTGYEDMKYHINSFGKALGKIPGIECKRNSHGRFFEINYSVVKYYMGKHYGYKYETETKDNNE